MRNQDARQTLRQLLKRGDVVTTDQKEMVRVETDIMGEMCSVLMSKEDAARELDRRKKVAALNKKLEAACMRARELYRDHIAMTA